MMRIMTFLVRAFEMLSVWLYFTCAEDARKSFGTCYDKDESYDQSPDGVLSACG
ncbi:hypothetical protein VIM7927_04211 [Vibrio mangrovi]|uniref:Uncharacterized protein n=1 Tax=Vibrio mangrovi TaxID=474394 RepID=A0A1Y6IZ00_9VIBR|nr:hypothetical protein VIM7927_04211 [Vibrio mangrovi]